MEISLWNQEFWWRSPALLVGAGGVFFLVGTWSERKIERVDGGFAPLWPFVREAVSALYNVVPAFAGIPLAFLFPSALGVDSSVWLPRLFKGLGMFAVLFLLLLGFAMLSEVRFGRYPWWRGLRDGVYGQSHWGFYRGIVAMTGAGIYAATWLGSFIALAEWALAGAVVEFPDRRRAARHLGILIATSALFLYSRNLWLCMMFHWLASSVL